MKIFKQLFLTIALVLVVAAPAFAAVTANSSVTPQTPTRGIVQFLQGTDTAGTYKTLYTGGASGSIIKGIYITSNDPSASHLVTCEVVNGGVKYGGFAINVPTTTPGYATGVGALAPMTSTNWPGLPLDSDGNPYLFLASASDTLQCTFATALTTSDKINLVAIAADF